MSITLGGHVENKNAFSACGTSGCFGNYQRTFSNSSAWSGTYGYTHDYTTSDFVSVGGGSTWTGLSTAINKIKSGYGPQQLDVSYSFVASGSRVKPSTYRDPKTYALRDYGGTIIDANRVGNFIDIAATGEALGVGFTEFTGAIVSAFAEWKGILEDTFRGLRVNFKNLGQELGTGLYNDTEISNTTPFAGFYKQYSMLNGTGYTEKVGDIRLGGMKMGRTDDASYSALAHAYYPNNNNYYRSILAKSGSVGGDIFFNLSYNWRTGEYVYNAKHKAPLTQQYSGTYDVKTVAMHEIGHALGAPHETNERSVMYNGTHELTTFSSLYPSGLKNGQATKAYTNASYGKSKSYSRDPSGEINSYIRNNF